MNSVMTASCSYLVHSPAAQIADDDTSCTCQPESKDDDPRYVCPNALAEMLRAALGSSPRGAVDSRA